ncbi:MAG: amidohydrolase family protein [Candidatus Latescibacteria bacterium]|jgi:uncharacterized protein|nr:amidohydrolase family protein [Candidatus Latescibacterota bacterium]
MSELYQSVIDTDIHNTIPSLKTLYPYLQDFWRDYLEESAFVGPDAHDYPAGLPFSARADSKSSDGPPGSQMELVRSNTIDAWKAEIGILTCNYWTTSIHHEDFALALSSAINDWQIDAFLNPEPRFRASLVVPGQNPELAAQEIDRLGGHPGFVQVIVPVRSHTLYGKRHFDPLYEAAVRNNLVVGIHYGGASGHPPTPTGWPVSFLEEYTGMTQLFQSQLLSLITEGAFNRHPDLKVSFIEGGFTWIPSFIWRMDKEWKGLRHELPWLTEPPSAYIHRHLRFTTQPMGAPPDPVHMSQILDQMGSTDLLMFATDYPHHHFDSPREALIKGIEEPLLGKIMAENARNWYALPN